VVVGTEFSDDAAVVRHGEDGRGLVLTTDVIAPIVDDPALFGEIAACNALSDVYAMGGRPLWALNLVFFPDDRLPLMVLREILAGGARACARAGARVVGGHSVRDPEPKYGLAVTGEVALAEVLSNRRGRAGQVLVLTKALGTGIVGTAIKQGVASVEEIAAAVASMTCLNDQALAAGRRHGVTACTDVTGFGLLGHLVNILNGSGVAGTVRMRELPALPGALGHAAAVASMTCLNDQALAAGRRHGVTACTDVTGFGLLGHLVNILNGSGVAGTVWMRELPALLGALEHAAAGRVPGGSRATLATLRPRLRVRGEEDPLRTLLAADAQTSGGLLFTVDEARADALVAELVARGQVGRVVGRLDAASEATPAGTITLDYT
jgi:selenium donor protein